MNHYRWLLLFGLWLLYCAFGLVASSLAPIAAQIISDLGMSHTEMGFTMGVWQLTYIVAAVPAGILLDKIGTQRALVYGGILVGLSALARCYAIDTPTMIMAVMLLGLGGPIVSSGAPKVVLSHFEGSTRGLAMGIYMTGPAIGGVISLSATHSVLLPMFDHSWRAVMMIWAAFTLFASFVWFFLSARQPTQISTVQSAAGLSQLRIISNLLRKPTVLLVLAMSASVFFYNHGLNNWLPELLRSNGMSSVNAGYWAAIPTIIGIAGSLMIPRLATPQRRFFILIGLSAAACFGSFLLQYDHKGILLTGLLLQGIAKSSLMTVLILTLVELPEIGEKYAGVASGLFFSVAQVGGVLGPLLLGMLYDPAAGFTAGLWLLTAISLTMIGGSILLQLRSVNPLKLQ